MFQNEVLTRIINKYREETLAHAYLIETNNIELATNDLKELVKVINCPHGFKDNCQQCNLCNLINKNNLPSLKIIEPDGASIKKTQIEDLKISFGTIPVYSKYNTYIIKNAEKLNSSSANSMLKFLEEPTPGILGFFITTNKDIMMDTIKSRCQSLILNYENNNILSDLNITEDEYKLYQTNINQYLTKIDNHGYINNKLEIINIFPERKNIEILFKIILNIYYNKYLQLLNYEYNPEFINIYEINDSLAIINQKLQIITKILSDLSYNVNIELILDKFVIEMRGTNG